MGSHFGIKFWGTRGLVSSPRQDTAEFGGNTSCMQILTDSNDIFVVDAGFGITNLGEMLLNDLIAKGKHVNLHLFLTHFHWDHIQGLPFFHPIYFPETNINIYSPMEPDFTLSAIDILFDGSYSPFSGLNSMPSNIKINQLNEPITINDLIIDFNMTDHVRNMQNINNTPTYCYKFSTSEGRSIVIATDHEARPSRMNNNLIQFAFGSEILVHDAQYFQKEYKHHEGWGHSTVEQAVNNGLLCECKHLILTHHAPFRSDSELSVKLAEIRPVCERGNMLIDFAKEEIPYSVNKQVRKAS